MLKTVGNLSIRSGDQTIIDGNLVIGTAGKGIDFSADPSAPGMTSELLDDYEIGTHTTAITCGTSGTITLLATADTLTYEKIGKLVHVHGKIDVDSVASPVGNFRFSLPFSIADLTEQSGDGCASVIVNSTVAANVSNFVASAPEGSASVFIYLGDATSIQNDSAQEIKAGSTIRVSVTYRTT